MDMYGWLVTTVTNELSAQVPNCAIVVLFGLLPGLISTVAGLRGSIEFTLYAI
jgi:hypothetical protein